MNTTLFLIGEAVIENAPLRRYIDRHLARYGIHPRETLLRRDAERLFEESPHAGDQAQQIWIFCDPALAALVAREIATYCGDNLVMRRGRLVPSMSVDHEADDYSLVRGHTCLHIIPARSGSDLPGLQPHPSETASALLHLFDTDEQAVKEALKQLRPAYRVSAVLSEPVPGWLQCRLETDRLGDLDGALQQLQERFPYSAAAENIALWIIERLEAEGRHITFAESCTGGLLSYYLTKESGASNIFDGALVTYSNRLKSAWIAVENAVLEAHGAVSRETVEAMSAGALDVARADYAVAVSGIAGPTGGTAEKPVGTVYVAVRSAERLQTAHLQLHGDRNYIQEQTVLHAVKMLLMLDKKRFFKISPEIS